MTETILWMLLAGYLTSGVTLLVVFRKDAFGDGYDPKWRVALRVVTTLLFWMPAVLFIAAWSD